MKYPNNRIFAIFDKGEDASRTITALLSSGTPTGDIEIFRDGVDEVSIASNKLLNPVFGEHPQTFPMGDVEDTTFQLYHRALEIGNIVLTVHSDTDETKDRVSKVLVLHNAYSINYYGPWTVEAL